MQDIKNAVDKLLQGELNPDELNLLLDALDSKPEYEFLKQYILEQIEQDAEMDDLDGQREVLYQRLDAKICAIPKKKKAVMKKITPIWRVVAAVLVIGLLTWLGYQQGWLVQLGLEYRGQHARQQQVSHIRMGNDQVLLNDLHIGDSIEVGGGVLRKSAEGELRYESQGNVMPVVDRSLSMVTGIRDSYKVVLPDGTVAWLNAQSSIDFPTVFKGDTRQVETKGEVFFEVKPAALAQNKPFVVTSGVQKITVLGTAFNIKSYPDEPIITSLLEGKVKLDLAGRTIFLKPGDQAVFDHTRNAVRIVSFDENTVMDWKSGYFVFNNASIQEVLDKLAKWYGFDQKSLPPLLQEPRINARIKRDIDVQTVLKSLEKISGLQFYMDADNSIRIRNPKH